MAPPIERATPAPTHANHAFGTLQMQALQLAHMTATAIQAHLCAYIIGFVNYKALLNTLWQ